MSGSATRAARGYEISQRVRERVEEVFGSLKTAGNFRKTRYHGLATNPLAAHMLAAAYDLLLIAKLTQATATPATTKTKIAATNTRCGAKTVGGAARISAAC